MAWCVLSFEYSIYCQTIFKCLSLYKDALLRNVNRHLVRHYFMLKVLFLMIHTHYYSYMYILRYYRRLQTTLLKDINLYII